MSAPSMPCNEVQQRLTAFLDGEIAGEECWSIRRHLESCPPCEQSAALEQKFKNVLRDRLERETAPAGLASRVREALAGGEAREHRIPERGRTPPEPATGKGIGRFVLAAMAGAGCALAGALFTLWIAGGERPAPGGTLPPGGGAPGIEALALSPIHLRGTIVCATCAANQAGLEQQVTCTGAGHLNGVRDEQGRLWHIHPRLATASRVPEAGKLEAPSLRGRAVQVDGQAVVELSYLLPRQVQLL